MTPRPLTTAPGRTALSIAPGASSDRLPGTSSRVLGVDLTRGLAVFGMMAVHVLGAMNRQGGPTWANVIAGGRSATTFALVAGISLAFITGGRRPLPPGRRAPAVVGIAVRGVLVGLLGLSLAYLGQADVILSSYGVLFLLAVVLVWMSPGYLAMVSVISAVLGPVVVLVAAYSPLHYDGDIGDPTLGALLSDPMGVLNLVLVSGSYPVVVYVGYLATGLAVGRLDLTSARVARRLLAGGLTLVAVGQGLAAWFLYRLGGWNELVDRADVDGAEATSIVDSLRWDPEPVDSWWYLALPSPHSHTPLDAVHTTGSALAVLGACLLLARLTRLSRLLRPLADVGRMPLTLYCAHLLVLATPLLDRRPRVLYLAMLTMACAFAMAWRRWVGQGPLERLLAIATKRAARLVTARIAHPGTPSAP